MSAARAASSARGGSKPWVDEKGGEKGRNEMSSPVLLPWKWKNLFDWSACKAVETRLYTVHRLAPDPLYKHRKLAALFPAALPRSLASPPKITRQGQDNHP